MLGREKALIKHTANAPDLLQIAILRVSGTMLVIGTSENADGNDVFIQTDENAEAIYMSKIEAEMLIASLQVAIKG
jgi:hypothetical protein